MPMAQKTALWESAWHSLVVRLARTPLPLGSDSPSLVAGVGVRTLNTALNSINVTREKGLETWRKMGVGNLAYLCTQNIKTCLYEEVY
jgi:hypothetical protein